MYRTKLPMALIAILTCICLAAPEAAVAGKKKREKRANKWPFVDLSQYSVLYIEDFTITDPKAHKRKKAVMVRTAPKRIADYVAQILNSDIFPDVRREGMPPSQAAVLLKVDITQYKPGSAFGRAMLAGAGSAHLDFTAQLIDATSGRQLSRFSDKRTWAWGGAYGASRGIEEMEQNLAHELALYLENCRNGT